MKIATTRAYKYCLWARRKNNKKTGKYVKLQAERWIKIADGKDSEAYVSQESLVTLEKILGLFMHPDLGVSLGEGLEDYAWFLITAVFCTKSARDNSRYYQTALLEIGRKNFKTFVSAVIFLVGLIAEPKYSRFFSVAPDFRLSNELFLAAKKIIKSSPETEGFFKIKRDEIICLYSDTSYTPLAYSRDKLDGKLANMFLADEAGDLDAYPVEAMRSSQITLKNKLGIIISTQYENNANVFIDEVDRAKKVLTSKNEKGSGKRYFALLFEPDEEIRGEWEKNDNVLYQANPASVGNKYIFASLRESRELAGMYENKKANFLCKHCNIYYKGLGTEGYIDVEAVKKCRCVYEKDFWKGKRVYAAFDLSVTTDNTSVMWVCREGGKVYAGGVGFIPSERTEIKTKKEEFDYRSEIIAGHCIECGGDVIDYNLVENYILTLERDLGLEIEQIGYDRYNALATVQRLETEGYEMVQVGQYSKVLHSATKYLEELVLNDEFRYEENKLLEDNFSNARCTYDTNLNRYVNKKRSDGKVDMVVALINAIYLLQQAELYETENLCLI
ncbi:MAG: terminase large subunit [Eubacterium sp.]|nr:terminase large subunit [Eubacterium sp.]